MAPESNSKVDRIEVLVNGEDRGTDLGILGYDHEWEYAVFGEDGIPESVRGKLQVAAYHFCGLRCITTVKGELENGEPFVWKARRHRKGRGIWGRFVRHRAQPFAWLDPRAFLSGDTMAKIRYCSALLLMMGASVFSFSNAVQLSAQIQPRSMQEPQPYQGYHLYDWLGSTPALVGLTTVAAGTFLKIMEANNTDLGWRRHVWKKHGCRGRRPGLKVVAFRPHNLGWWGTCFRMCGASSMGMASIVNFINQTAHVKMSADFLYLMMYLPYIVGPAFLFCGCALLTLESSDPWWEGFFLYRPRQFRSLTFWITFLANMGALGLLIGGICHWEKQEIMDQSGMWAVQLYRGLAYLFFGSFLLDASAFLTLVEISNPEL